jgi:hypothetical protein
VTRNTHPRYGEVVPARWCPIRSCIDRSIAGRPRLAEPGHLGHAPIAYALASDTQIHIRRPADRVKPQAH